MVEDELYFLFDCDYYHKLDKYKDMSLFGCINHSFKKLTNNEKWIFISNISEGFISKLFFIKICWERIPSFIK